MVRILFITFLILGCSESSAEGIFDEAVRGSLSEDTASENTSYDMNGYIRGVLYGGKVPGKQTGESKSVYGETSLKMTVKKGSSAKGFAELRYRRGNEFNESISECRLREAYIDMYIGDFDIRFGEQVVVWGRADGFNPTNTITPADMLIRSPDEDDRRESNFLIRSRYSVRPFRIETILIPAYSASVLPLRCVTLPHGVTLDGSDYPDSRISNGGYAVKVDLELASFDGSLSYFNGFNPLPGINAELGDDGAKIIPTAYRTHVYGTDFSTVMRSFGLRGELAYRNPWGNYRRQVCIPNPDVCCVLGGDTSIGDFNVILQYIGRAVIDFEALSEPSDTGERMLSDLSLYNRMFFSQIEEVTHSMSFRPAWALLHQTLDAEMLGMYNFTTGEVYLKPKLSYDVADDLSVTLGGEVFNGPGDTLYDLLESRMSALFIEFKTTF